MINNDNNEIYSFNQMKNTTINSLFKNLQGKLTQT